MTKAKKQTKVETATAKPKLIASEMVCLSALKKMVGKKGKLPPHKEISRAMDGAVKHNRVGQLIRSLEKKGRILADQVEILDDAEGVAL